MAVKKTQPGKPALTAGPALLQNLVRQQRQPLQLSVVYGVLATLTLVLSWGLIALLVQWLLLDQRPLFSTSSIAVLSALALLLLLRALLQQQQELQAAEASVAARLQLRQQLLQQWQRQGAWSLQQDSPAVHATKWLEDVDAIDGYFARYWPQRQLMVLSPLIILLAIAYHDWLVALLLLIAAPLIPFFMALIGMGAEQLNQRHLLQRQRLAGHFLDRLRQIPLLNRMGASDRVQLELAGRSEQYRHLVMGTLKVAFLSSAVLEFFSSVAIAALAMYIGFGLFGAISWGPAAALTLASGLFMLALAPEFFQPLRQFAQSYHDKAAALAAANALASAFNQQPMAKAAFVVAQDAPLSSSATYRLTVNQLAIAYPDKPILQRELSFQLQTGQCLVISGRSGIGKSTLLQTLAGLLPPAAGQIQFARADDDAGAAAGAATETKAGSTTAACFYQPQRPWIIHGSIRDNLLLLCTDEIKQQLTSAQLLAVLATLGLTSLCPDTAALDKPLSERGEGVSGGQLQRIALARVLLSPLPYVLLDEPTSSLDASSRQLVLQALAQLKTQCILVLVSHEPAVQALADVHLVLQERADA